MNLFETIALYKTLNKLMSISDPDSSKVEAISYTMQIVKEYALDRYDIFLNTENI